MSKTEFDSSNSGLRCGAAFFSEITFLEEIIELKKKRLQSAKANRDFEELKESAIAKRKTAKKHRLRENLRKNQINIIAEIKRASPSKGIINDKIDVAETARSYEKGGASAISVLTEEDRFKGSLEDLRAARNAVDLPILRKDFIFDEFQIYEATEAGADVILLIAAMLDDEVLQKLHHLAEAVLGLDAMVEVHTLEELERVKKIGAKIIGVNNRDLHSFQVSLDTSRELIKHALADALMITESGIRAKDEILELRELGFSGFLIGETLMRSGNVERDLRELATNDTNKKNI
jgi:indole-3-glycerol phosphate synthase